MSLFAGEVDDASILANKETTKSYWEAKLQEAAENQKNLLIKHIAADSLTQAIASVVKEAKMVAETPNNEAKDLRNGAVVSPPPEFRLVLFSKNITHL
jgi:hypothetical protein